MKNSRFLIKFKHEGYVPPCPTRLLQPKGIKSKTLENRYKTTCIIAPVPTSEEPEPGLSISASVGCYYKDTPNRKVGNLEAFRKTVSQIPSKADRTELWNLFKAKGCLNCN
jgi:hypothetical protein